MNQHGRSVGDPGEHNVRRWATGNYVSDYSEVGIIPAEAVMLARHGATLTGRVLELGCGTGRLTRVLAGLAHELRALDVSPRMVEACRANVPRASVAVGDLRDLSGLPDASADAIVASANVLDVLGDADRQRTLAELARVLAPGGVLLFSSHNRAHIPFMASPLHFHRDALRSPRNLARAVWRAGLVPHRTSNRRRSRLYERSEADYAIVNDEAHHYRMAHYYIGRDAQERQLAAVGLTLVDCIAKDCTDVHPGADAPASSALQYAGRRTSTD